MSTTLSKTRQNRTPETKTGAKNPRVSRDGRRLQILDAAEKIFAEFGYAGAGMRQISSEAGVAQALIHYHFDTKVHLFEQVIARRSGEINRLRSERLDALFTQKTRPALEDITDVLLRPTLEIGHRLAQTTNDFARILVHTANSADRRSVDLTKRYYDPIARRFIKAFETVTPGLGNANAVWAYLFAIGVGMTMMAQTGRPQRLSGGRCDDTDVDAILARAIPFVAAGIRAVAIEKS